MSYPLFSIPNLVLFPRVKMPLYIFEQRYRQLILELTELPKDERLMIIATSLGEPSNNFLDDSPFSEVATLAKLVNYTIEKNGTIKIQIEGLFPVITEEIDYSKIDTLYRQVNTAKIPGNWHGPHRGKKKDLKSFLFENLIQYFKSEGKISISEKLHELQRGDFKNYDIGSVFPVMLASLPFRTDLRLELLKELDWDDRFELLIKNL